MSRKTRLQTVTLLKAHRHADVDYPAGEKIQVTETTRQWLQDRNVIASSKNETTNKGEDNE